MSEVKLVEVTVDNLRPICKMSDTLTPKQQECVAPNAYSIAQAHFYPDNAWYRGIYLDEIPIGFLMIDTNPDELPEEEKPGVMLWRFMIAKDYQGKGYAKKALDIIVDKYKKEGKKVLYTSCVMSDEGPYEFYIKYGFIDTGEMEDDEEILKLAL